MFLHIINSIKLGYSHKNKFIKIKINKTEYKLINFLIKINIIKYVFKKQIKNNNKNKTTLYLNYINNKPVFKNIINLYKPSRFFYINLKNLIKINKKKNFLIVLSTNKGIITNFEAEKNKIGGKIITKIFL